VVGEAAGEQLVEAVVLRDEVRAREWLEARALWSGYAQASVTGDMDGLMAVYHPDARIVDHRHLSFQDAADRNGIREIYVGFGRLLTGCRATVEVLDVHPGSMAMSVTWAGTDRVTGGDVEWRTFHAARRREGLTEEAHTFGAAADALAKAEELRIAPAPDRSGEPRLG
jgi:hypothetical protein